MQDDGDEHQVNTPGVSDEVNDHDAEVSSAYAGDPLLNLLIHLAETGIKCPVTLYSSGQVFTGTIAARKEYFELMRDFVGESALKHVFESVLDQGGFEYDPEEPAPGYTFVHLSNGKVMSPGSNGMPTEGTPVRIKRSEIIGWHLGSLSASAN